MEIEKRRSKGSFLSFFYCNGVSRKKLFRASPCLPGNHVPPSILLISQSPSLPRPPIQSCSKHKLFSSKSAIHVYSKYFWLILINRTDGLKQAKENVGNMPESQLNTAKVGENDINPSGTAKCDFNCELSASIDKGCETKAPCLVARLMGLDSLPTSTVNKLSFIASRSSKSLVSSRCHENDVYPMRSGAHETENRTIETRQPKNAATRVLDFKQKSEAAHQASMQEKIMDTNTVKGSRYSENIGSHCNWSRGKSTLLAIQAKAEGQCGGTLTSNGNRAHEQKEQSEIASNQFFRTQKPILQQAMKQRTCKSRSSHYKERGQNMQMQNSATVKVRSTSIVEPNKPTARSSTCGARKVTNKNFVFGNVKPKSSGRRATGAKEGFSPIKTKSNSMRKRYPRRDVLSANVVNSCEVKSIKCNITTDGSMNQDTLNKEPGKDVVSFTFTSPLKKESQPSTHTNNVGVIAPGLHLTYGDASSELFDGKTQDLASRINSPECNLATRVSSAVLLRSEVGIGSGEGDRSFASDPPGGDLQGMHNCGCSSNGDLMLNMNQQLQRSKAIRQHSSDNNIEIEYSQGLNSGLVSQAAEQDQTIRSEQVKKTIVFDVLEKWSSGTESDGDEHLKVERNLLFDFVSEFLELRRSRRDKGRALESQIWWEEDLCREMKRFKSMQESMVDELVNMDMSSPHGTWLHFQTEPFHQILLSEIEWDISTSLINDLLLELLHH
ncbi:uncharacterized protein LOC114735901 isoform X2 [Neltuma alba]|uniref:uncharacterized protein LOC114735901 isoform X2 n=1 Tax=Neltuma alba TaxID=207710 RepID=UPI0010A3C594|nr:uncharacterized protein LOC114735901 isoform X2 [Prosopis alba]